MTRSEHLWQAVDEIKNAKRALDAARVASVLACAGEFSVKLQSQLAKMDKQLESMRKRIVVKISSN